MILPVRFNPHLSSLRRIAAEMLAYTMTQLFPRIQCAGGGLNTLGFFYDFVFDQPLDQEGLSWIESRLRTFIKEGVEMRFLSMMRENAHPFFLHHHQPWLAELALEEEQNIISLIQINDFYGLCSSSSIEIVEELKWVRLLGFSHLSKIIREEEIDVIRIEGTVFAELSSLKQFMKVYDKFKKWDHREIGPSLRLFTFLEQEGNLQEFWYPKGIQLKKIFKDFWEMYGQSLSMQPISTPPVEEVTVYSIEKRLKQHLSVFKDLTAFTSDPICLGEFYQADQKLPLDEQWGLFYSSIYESDLITIYSSEKQVVTQLIYFLQFIEKLARIFGFKTCWYLLTLRHKGLKAKPKSLAVQWLTEALEHLGINFTLQEIEKAISPCIEMRLEDPLGRQWRSSAIGVKVLAEDPQRGEKRVVLWESLFCSLERWIALLIEHYQGELPFWLVPEQVRILTVGEQNEAYAQGIYTRCKQNGVRAYLDSRSEKLGTKVHEAEKERVPYLLIIGDQERIKGVVSVRALGEKKEAQKLTLEEFLSDLDKLKISKLGVHEVT